jgi:DNA-directed RNA polymerase subunit RPC12/RpoP
MAKRKTLKDIVIGICTECGRETLWFKSKEAQKEFAISGLCQTCQVKAFGKVSKPRRKKDGKAKSTATSETAA